MERRSFLKWATAALGAVFGAVLGIPAIAYLIDPRNRPAPAGQFKPVGRLSELVVDVPQQAVIHDVRRDAWTLRANEIIGRVWLVRRGPQQVDAYTTICPHLGCSINFEKPSQRFVCPCHGGTFSRSGRRIGEQELGRSNPAPRGMDTLAVRMAPTPDGKDYWIDVKYQNFIQGLPIKVAKA